MLPDRYLIAGLDALSRAHRTPTWQLEDFKDGHRGAGLIAGYFLARDGLLEPQAETALMRALDAEWMARPLVAPMVDEPCAPSELSTLLAVAAACVGSTQGEVHHTIFLAAALKALAHRPDLITSTRIAGLCRMEAVYRLAAAPVVPPATAFDAAAFSSLVLERFCAAAQAYAGRVQNFTGHVLTFGSAVVDLHDLGYDALARQAEVGFHGYAASALLAQQGPFAMPPKTDPPARTIALGQAAFWESQPAGRLEATLAHSLKYSAALLTLLARSRDPAVEARSRALAYLILD